MRLVTAPASRPSLPGGLFLAGSIEQGVADDWQTRVIRALETTTVTIYNPRRPDWDASWGWRADNWCLPLGTARQDASRGWRRRIGSC